MTPCHWSLLVSSKPDTGKNLPYASHDVRSSWCALALNALGIGHGYVQASDALQWCVKIVKGAC